jgi:hypothetical protein
MYFFLGITNKMQLYTILFITVNALYVSGGFFAEHQELKNCTHSIGYMSSLLAATASVGELKKIDLPLSLPILNRYTIFYGPKISVAISYPPLMLALPPN